MSITPNDAMSARFLAGRAATAFPPKGHAVQSMFPGHLCLCVPVQRSVRVWRSFAAPFPQNICKGFGGDFLPVRGFPYLCGKLDHFAVSERTHQIGYISETVALDLAGRLAKWQFTAD